MFFSILNEFGLLAILVNMEETKKRHYSNSARSEASIKGALLRLLSKGHDLNSISVKELAKEAGLTRGTFYNHYDGVDDVIKSLENDFIGKLGSSLEEANLNDEAAREDFFNKLDLFLSETYVNMKAIVSCIPLGIYKDIKAKLNQTISETMIKKMPGYANDKSIQSKVRFFVNGLSGSYVDSILDPKGPSIHETSLEGYKLSNLFFTPTR